MTLQYTHNFSEILYWEEDNHWISATASHPFPQKV